MDCKVYLDIRFSCGKMIEYICKSYDHVSRELFSNRERESLAESSLWFR